MEINVAGGAKTIPQKNTQFAKLKHFKTAKQARQ